MTINVEPTKSFEKNFDSAAMWATLNHILQSYKGQVLTIPVKDLGFESLSGFVKSYLESEIFPVALQNGWRMVAEQRNQVVYVDAALSPEPGIQTPDEAFAAKINVNEARKAIARFLQNFSGHGMSIATRQLGWDEVDFEYLKGYFDREIAPEFAKHGWVLVLQEQFLRIHYKKP